MSVFSKLAGIVGTFFTWGPTGPGINANGAALETKNNANAALAIHRGADAVGPTDFVNLESLVSAGGVLNAIVVTPGTAASTSSTAKIPAGAIVLQCQINVTTAYSGGATIEVGYAGTLAAFMGTPDNNPQVATSTIFGNPQQTTVVAAEAVTVTIGGAPGAGVSQVLVWFVVPLT